VYYDKVLTINPDEDIALNGRARLYSSWKNMTKPYHTLTIF
jgi:hypothetical protein